MADKIEMVVVDGIRYRPEDAPKRETQEPKKDAGKKSAAKK